MAMRCGCRRKQKESKLIADTLLNEFRLFNLSGSCLQAAFTAALSAALPQGLYAVMPGFPNPVGQGYTIVVNTSNTPDPTLPSVGTGPQQVPSAVIYQTPQQIWPYTPIALFIQAKGDQNAVNPADINQGSLGDCWMMTALSLLAGYGSVGPALIQSAFASVSPAGSSAPTSVTVNLYKLPSPSQNIWKSQGPALQQTVTNRIPVLQSHPQSLAFVMSDSPGEYWPSMMEKAAAAAMTQVVQNGPSSQSYVGYSALISGMPSLGMSLFTPGFPVQYQLSSQPPAGALFNAWNTCMANGIAVACSWISNPDRTQPSIKGLLSGHAYGVFAIVAINGLQLALIRNPWGDNSNASSVLNQNSAGGEWTGAWSDYDPAWNNPANAAVVAACKYTGPHNDGLFWMSFVDIATYLNTYEIFIPDRQDMKIDIRSSPFGSAPVCTDTPVGWKDLSGNTCATFAGAGMCAAGAPQVNPASLQVSYYQSPDGNTPLTACCACGGGSTGNSFKPCTDSPNGWKDLAGNTCATFAGAGMCVAGKVVGSLASLQSFKSADGRTPDVACCACGGGQR